MSSNNNIVFCNTFNDLSTILSYLLVLKEKAFTDDHNGKRTSLLGVYHAKSWNPRKCLWKKTVSQMV